mmetsp:Transcript_9371/g.25885  ORF Transcript_9371/g.25885 Transcript_9371/m.25885 type:complete len:463 (+) Transcript_9371:888-2276(+)
MKVRGSSSHLYHPNQTTGSRNIAELDSPQLLNVMPHPFTNKKPELNSPPPERDRGEDGFVHNRDGETRSQVENTAAVFVQSAAVDRQAQRELSAALEPLPLAKCSSTFQPQELRGLDRFPQLISSPQHRQHHVNVFGSAQHVAFSHQRPFNPSNNFFSSGAQEHTENHRMPFRPSNIPELMHQPHSAGKAVPSAAMESYQAGTANGFPSFQQAFGPSRDTSASLESLITNQVDRRVRDEQPAMPPAFRGMEYSGSAEEGTRQDKPQILVPLTAADVLDQLPSDSSLADDSFDRTPSPSWFDDYDKSTQGSAEGNEDPLSMPENTTDSSNVEPHSSYSSTSAELIGSLTTSSHQKRSATALLHSPSKRNSKLSSRDASLPTKKQRKKRSDDVPWGTTASTTNAASIFQQVDTSQSAARAIEPGGPEAAHATDGRSSPNEFDVVCDRGNGMPSDVGYISVLRIM